MSRPHGQAPARNWNNSSSRTTVDLVASLDQEQRRAVEEGLTEEEYALFSLLLRDDLTKADRERLKLSSQKLLKSLHNLLAPLEQWTRKEQTQAEVEKFILDEPILELMTITEYAMSNTFCWIFC